MTLLVKVCGLTQLEDVAFCYNLGVDLIGFIFARKSPRFIEPHLVASFPSGTAKRVGVFVDNSLEEIQEIAQIAQLDLIQLHGHQDVSFCQSIGYKKVVKVLWPDSCSSQELQLLIDQFADSCSYYLLDSGKSGGGSGTTMNWDKIKTLNFPKPWFIAGGLGADTISTALKTLAPIMPHGLDLNSALETFPGIKDKSLVKSAFSVIQNYETI